MLPTNVFVVVPMMAALTFGAALPEPNPADAETLALMTTMTAYINENWEGQSQDFTFTIGGDCYSLIENDFNDHIASIKVEDGYRCRLWQSGKCDKKSTADIYAPGAKAIAGELKGKVSSFKCYKN
ncbi:uncharacterized protein LTHEOB_12437 [Neofusicoccum parvum]|nr:uncharacterized protein LTHEOB_12437 [Neofusicoccum parvum]